MRAESNRKEHEAIKENEIHEACIVREQCSSSIWNILCNTI